MKFTKKQQKILVGTIIGISLITAILSYFVLPEQVVIQITLNTAPNRFAPKEIAIFIPIAFCVLGSLSYLESQEKSSKKIGSILIIGLGLLLPIFTFVINR